MSFKTLLAVVEYGDQLTDCLSAPIELTRTFDAHLTVLVVGEVPPLPFYGYGGQGYLGVWLKEGEDRARNVQEAARSLEERLERAGISYDVRPHQAIVAREDNLVARHAIYSDLPMLVRTGEGPLTSLERQAIDGALFDSGRPLMLLPRRAQVWTPGGSIMAAWNSRPEAAEALADALPLLKAAGKVILLVVDPETGPDDHGEDPGADIALVLARHGLAVEVCRAASAGRAVSDVLRAEAVRLGIDLIVMGAYGHSRLKQTILGGTTRNMLENSPIPLFMAH